MSAALPPAPPPARRPSAEAYEETSRCSSANGSSGLSKVRGTQTRSTPFFQRAVTAGDDQREPLGVVAAAAFAPGGLPSSTASDGAPNRSVTLLKFPRRFKCRMRSHSNRDVERVITKVVAGAGFEPATFRL
jgi:hypothetical protein